MVEEINTPTVGYTAYTTLTKLYQVLSASPTSLWYGVCSYNEHLCWVKILIESYATVSVIGFAVYKVLGPFFLALVLH